MRIIAYPTIRSSTPFGQELIRVQSPTRFAFTLVELLVVIAIIGVLVSLALPALGRANASTHSTICRSNLRQLGVAAYSYNVDAGRLPTLLEWLYRRPVDGADLTSGQLYPYVKSKKVFLCPTDQLRRPRGEWMRTDLKDHSYKMNCMMCHAHDLSACLTPAKSMFFMELTDLTQDTGGGMTSDDGWSTQSRPAFHHKQRGNLLMVDGHVESLKETEYRRAAATREFWYPTGKSGR